MFYTSIVLFFGFAVFMSSMVASCVGRSGFGHPIICHVSQFDSSALFTDFIGIRSRQSKTFKVSKIKSVPENGLKNPESIL